MRDLTTHLDGEIRNGRHVMAVRVYYEDTDFSGVVYHASYLRFMERGRTNYLRLLGADHRALFEETTREAPGFAFVVRSMTIEFLKPARMDDILEIVTAPAEIKGASITLRQQIMRGEDLIIEAQVKVAFVSGGKARPIPKPLRIAMRADQDTGRQGRVIGKVPAWGFRRLDRIAPRPRNG
jgi:acyl-CoA thioester hydrolase